MTEFFLVSETARQLGCSADTVRDLERRGKIKAARTLNGTRIFTADEVRRLKQERDEKLAARPMKPKNGRH